jgi:hypothetical protein
MHILLEADGKIFEALAASFSLEAALILHPILDRATAPRWRGFLRPP